MDDQEPITTPEETVTIDIPTDTAPAVNNPAEVVTPIVNTEEQPQTITETVNPETSQAIESPPVPQEPIPPVETPVIEPVTSQTEEPVIEPVVQQTEEIKTQQNKRNEKGQFTEGNTESVGNSGRPCSYCAKKEKYQTLTDDYIDKTLNSAKPGIPFIEELSLMLRIDVGIMKDWSEKKNEQDEFEHPEFRLSYARLKTLQKLRLLQRTLGRYNPQGSIFLLKVNHDMIESEKRIITGDKNEPLQIEIIEEKKIENE